VRSRVTAGSTLAEGLIDGLSAGPPPLRSAATTVDDAVRFGPGLTAALESLRMDLADPIADRVLLTIAIADRSGGRRVGEVLAALSISVADELCLRRAHEAAMTEQRLTAAVALFAPWALLVLTIATNPQASDAYRSTTGALVITIGLVGTGLGFLLARRSARLAEAPRVFG
jgi:tight adherence protein B